MEFTLEVKPEPSSDHVQDWGPAAKLEHRTGSSQFQQLGTYFMNFHDTGLSDPWTIQYEETVYVIEGQVTVVIHEDDQRKTVTADKDELLALPKGTTVQYGGTPGTRLLLSIAPVNWRTVNEKLGE